MPAPPEDVPTRFRRHDPYPGIAIENFIGKYKGKVLFVTGASNGIGEHTAKAFAKAGANVFLCARRGPALERVKKEILEEEGGQVEVESAIVDVSKEADVKNAVEKAVKKFGRIDFVVSNAGVMSDTGHKLGESNIEEWSFVINVNLIGPQMVARYTIPELLKTKGYIIFVGSRFAQLRISSFSSYGVSKHAVNRLCEWVVEEYGKEGIKSFVMHPGTCDTGMSGAAPQYRHLLIDSLDLGPYTQLRLVSGSEDWLSGRYLSANWDLDELNKYKKDILEIDGLKSRLTLPLSLQVE